MFDIIIWIILTILFTYILKNVTSSENNKIKFNFYFFAYYMYGSFVACVVWPFFLLRPKSVQNAKFAANIIKHITKLYGLKWELRNGEVLAEDRGAVIVANHQSSLDVLGMFNIWNVVDKLAAVAKKELFYVWPFGLAAYLSGVVFVDRRNPKGAYKQLQVCADAMKKDKSKLWLFPEGTRNKDHTKLLPFKKGAFVIAVAAQAPIIPVVYSPYYFINKKKNIFDKGHIIINCLDPIPTEGLTMEDIPELLDRVYNRMNDTYKKIGFEVLNPSTRTETFNNLKE